MKEIYKLSVVSVEEKRDIVPMGHRDVGGEMVHDELAVGMKKARLFVRSSSGTLYVLDCPQELADEITDETQHRNVCADFGAQE